MQEIRVEDISNVEKKIVISVDNQTVDTKFKEFFQSIKKEAQVPGFRKGKASANVLQRYFKDKAKAAVAQLLLSEFYQKALKDYDIKPIGSPKLNVSGSNSYPGDFTQDNNYNVELGVEVLPKLDPTGYMDLDLKQDLSTPSADFLYEAKVSELRNQFAERNQVDTEAQAGDTVVIDFKGYVDGEVFNGGEQQGFTIDALVEGGTLIPGFEEQLVGMKAGEQKEVLVKFPENYNASFLSGKDAKFDVKLTTVVRKTLAAVNEDLALMAGFDSLDAMTNTLQENAKNTAYKRTIEDTINLLSRKLLETNHVDLPNNLIQNEKSRIVNQYKGKKLTQELFSQLLSYAEFNLKRALLLEAIYDKEELSITPEELDKQLEEQASLNNMSKDDVVSNLYNSNQMDAFMGVLRAQKVAEFVLNQRKESVDEQSSQNNL